MPPWCRTQWSRSAQKLLRQVLRYTALAGAELRHALCIVAAEEMQAQQIQQTVAWMGISHDEQIICTKKLQMSCCKICSCRRRQGRRLLLLSHCQIFGFWPGSGA